MEKSLSPRQFAEAIGVSESSVRRWADSGQLQMTRTAGGHRKIPRAEAIRFVRESSIDVVRPDLLLTSEPTHRRQRANAFASQHDQLLKALEDGDGELVSGLITGMYVNGVSAADICDGALRHALHRIGDKWPTDKRGIFLEHRATNICIDALHRLRAGYIHTTPQAAAAVGGAPSKDPYVLPSLMAATVLADVGLQPVNLGPDTPMDVLADSCLEMEATVVWIAVTSASSRAATEQALADLCRRLRKKRTQIIIGGRSAHRYKLPANPNLQVFDSMSEMAGFAKSLVNAT